MIQNKQNGFTLIEVLIALIILAIAFFAVMKVMQNAVRETNHVQQVMLSRWVAMDVLTKMQIGLQTLPTENQIVSGHMAMLNQNWAWESGVAISSKADYERVYINVFQNSNKVMHIEGFVMKRTRL